MAHNYSPEYQLVMLGAGSVGKSMLTTRFINGGFNDDYDPTIEDSYRKVCQVDGREYVLDILDTAGQEEYVAMREQYMRSGHGFIIVYSITSPSSLAEAESLALHVKRVKDSDVVPIVLVGNKSDLHDMRRVDMAAGHRLAARIQSGFYETSAKMNVNVHDVFVQCVRRIRHFNQPVSHTAQSETSVAGGPGRPASSVRSGNRNSAIGASGMDKTWRSGKMPARRGKNSMELRDSDGYGQPLAYKQSKRRYNKDDIKLVGPGATIGTGNLGTQAKTGFAYPDEKISMALERSMEPQPKSKRKSKSKSSCLIL